MASKKHNAKDESIFCRSALAQIFAVSIKNFVLVGYGMTLGFPTLLIPILSKQDNGEPFFLETEGLSWIGSIGMICVPLGAVVSGIVTQPLGRKKSMQLINIPFCVAWIFYYFSNEIWHIFMALIINGLAGGLMEAPVLTYVAEICQPHLRGMLGSASTMSVIAGMMIQFILGTFLKWRSVALCCGVMPIVSFNLLFLIPESPIWLLSKGRYEEAKKSFAWLRGWVSTEDISEEYDELFECMNKTELIINKKNYTENLNENGQIGKLTVWKTLKLLKHRSCMRPYILVTYICFLSHFNGMSAVQTYAVNIFNVLQVPIDGHFATALIGIVEMLGCIICVSMVRYTGKRLLAFISLNGTAICFVVLGIYTYSFHVDSLIKTEKNDTLINSTTALETNFSNPVVYSWIPLVFIIAAAFLSHMGIRVLPWILIGEVFSNETRAIASGMSGANFYIFGFLCNKIFLSMVSQLTLPITFWCFGGFSITGFIVLYFVLPETEGKSLIEISNHFSGKTKLGNDIFLKRKHDISIDEASETLYYKCNTE